MKAIVLSCDKYNDLAEHMIFQYNKLWEDHPFTFRIPYQKIESIHNCRDREYIKSPVGIKDTVLTLIEDLQDDEWVYWCMDDRYPIELNLKRINEVFNWILNFKNLDISGVLFYRYRYVFSMNHLKKNKYYDNDGNIYRERKNYNYIWIHQFLKVKVLRYLFEQFPDIIPNAKFMDSLKSQIKLPKCHRLLVTEDNLAVFGESTTRGKLTLNCYENLIENNLPLPKSISLDNNKTVIIGKPEEERLIFLILKRIAIRLRKYLTVILTVINPQNTKRVL